ncbi:MAG TPA: BlaI/MecI/CopY family transcriptional regulator [bacterium]|nr:BlaI/MecI/CopY family transcriptional regulator [bacterium]
MARTRSPVLTPVETEIMKVLWDHGAASVATVTEGLPGKRHYNTVLTILRILEQKGYVKHQADPNGRGYLYSTKVSRGKATKMFVRDLVDRMFGGRLDALIANLIEEEGISSAEIKRIQSALSRGRKSK